MHANNFLPSVFVLSKMFYNEDDTNSILFYEVRGIIRHSCVTVLLTTHHELRLTPWDSPPPLMPGWRAELPAFSPSLSLDIKVVSQFFY